MLSIVARFPKIKVQRKRIFGWNIYLKILEKGNMYTKFENSEMTVRGFFFLVGEGGGGVFVARRCKKQDHVY